VSGHGVCTRITSLTEDTVMNTRMNTRVLAPLAITLLILAGCGREAGQDVAPSPPQGGSAAQSTANPKAGGVSTGSGTGTTGGQGNYGTSTPTGPTGTGGGTTDTTPSGTRSQEPASASR
jgi:hypothetical protein